MQRCITILVIIVFIIFSSTANSIELNQKNANITFSPKDMDIKDDAFHSSDRYNYLEWWYFDAVFNNKYSLHTGIQIFDIMKRYFVLIRLNIYKDGNLVITKEKICFMKNFYASKDIPFIKANGKQIMKGYIDQDTKKWRYDLSLEFNDISTDLQFVGKAKGWKGETSVGGWAVILPKAEVTGTIKTKNAMR